MIAEIFIRQNKNNEHLKDRAELSNVSGCQKETRAW